MVFDHDHGVRGRRRGAGGHSDGWVPSGDGAVNGGEKKIGGCARSQKKVRGAGVGDGAGGSAGGEGLAAGVGFGNRHDEWIDGPSAVVEGTQPVPLSETHQGLLELRESPQGFTSVRSVTGPRRMCWPRD